MTRQAITARNRANAAKSTGPRSDVGKAAVAQNARRHGATAQPDPEHVATWARIILDDPDLGPNELLSDDSRVSSAFALAAAEARLAEATRALDQFEAGTAPPTAWQEELRNASKLIRDELETEPMSAQHRRQGKALIARMLKARIKESAIGGNRHRLLRRYWREARAQRKRAFQDFLASLQEQTAA